MAFPDDLVKAALDELAFWTDGNFRECVPGASPSQQPGSKRVARYWKEGLGNNFLDGCAKVNGTRPPWSAAFICFCMRQADMPLIEFPFSAAHHTYIRWAVHNTKQNKANKTFYGRRVHQHHPKPGDLVAQWRKSKSSDPDPNISFDVQPDDFYPSHCDIVVEVSATKIVTVGGNVGNRVKKTTFLAQGGILAPKKELICVMECLKP